MKLEIRKIYDGDVAKPWRVLYGGLTEKHMYSFNDALFFVRAWLRVNSL